MTIQIPVDFSAIVFRDAEGKELPQRWAEPFARAVLETASAMWRKGTKIEFRFGTYERVTEEMPEGLSPDPLTEDGFHYLVSRHKAGNGVRVLLVERLDPPKVRGLSREDARVCLVTYGADQGPVSRYLGHELGHLLGLDHVDAHLNRDPGQERENAAAMANLMFSGALSPANGLNADQLSRVKRSALVRRFGAR